MGYGSYLEDTTRRLDDTRHDLSSLRRDLGSSSMNSLEEVRLHRIDETIQNLVRTIDRLLEVATDPSLELPDLYLTAQRQLEQQTHALKNREDELQRLSAIIRTNNVQLRAASCRIEELENEQSQICTTTDRIKAQMSRMDAQIAQLRVDVSARDLEIQKLEKLVMPALLAVGDKNGKIKDRFR